MKVMQIVLLLVGAILFSSAHADLSLAPPASSDYIESNTITAVDLSAAETPETPSADYATTLTSTSALPSRINTKSLRSDDSFFQSFVSLFKPAKTDDSSVNISLRKRMVTFSFAF